MQLSEMLESFSHECLRRLVGRLMLIKLYAVISRSTVIKISCALLPSISQSVHYATEILTNFWRPNLIITCTSLHNPNLLHAENTSQISWRSNQVQGSFLLHLHQTIFQYFSAHCCLSLLTWYQIHNMV